MAGESAAGIVIGVGAGAAASAALEPAIEVPKQEAWKGNPYRLLDPQIMARLVAQGGVDLSTAHEDGLRHGLKTGNMDALVYLEQTVPGFAQALELWRRGFISDALMSHALVKAGLDQRFAAALLRLKEAELVGIGDVAYGIVRGILPSPSYVPVPPPTSGTSVPRFPQLQIDPEALALELGYSPEMLQLMVGRSGLSLAPGLAAQAFFRGLINDADYHLAIAEGDLRTEWANTLRGASRAIPSPVAYAEGWLRGYLTQTEAEDGAARHGMDAPDLDLEHLIRGRPVPIHQVTTGLARGGTYPSLYTDVPEPFRDSIRESDIKEPWASIAYANRYTYPSAFVLRSLAQAGDLGGQPAVEQVLLEIGWKPSFAQQVSTAWTSGGSSGDTHLSKAQTQVWTATHKAYVDFLISDATATTALEAAGVAAASVPGVLALWQAERNLVRASLSAAQIKKAWKEQAPDPALGRPWTEAEAVTRLVELGYTADDAQILLTE